MLAAVQCLKGIIQNKRVYPSLLSSAFFPGFHRTPFPVANFKVHFDLFYLIRRSVIPNWRTSCGPACLQPLELLYHLCLGIWPRATSNMVRTACDELIYEQCRGGNLHTLGAETHIGCSALLLFWLSLILTLALRQSLARGIIP